MSNRRKKESGPAGLSSPLFRVGPWWCYRALSPWTRQRCVTTPLRLKNSPCSGLKRGQPGPVKAKVHTSRTKQMLLAFFDSQGLIYSHIVPKGSSVNGKFNVKALGNFLKQWRSKGLRWFNRNGGSTWTMRWSIWPRWFRSGSQPTTSSGLNTLRICRTWLRRISSYTRGFEGRAGWSVLGRGDTEEDLGRGDQEHRRWRVCHRLPAVVLALPNVCANWRWIRGENLKNKII